MSPSADTPGSATLRSRLLTGRAAAARDALLVLMRADATLSPLGPLRGYPVVFRNETTWVSSALDFKARPVSSNLSSFETELEIGVGIAVTQFIREDWAPLWARMDILSGALEALVRADVTISGTCSRARLSKATIRESVPSDKQGRLTAYLQILATQFLG